jgi:hypothetical protein
VTLVSRAVTTVAELLAAAVAAVYSRRSGTVATREGAR